ncbi:MAG: hypothetical protein JXB49_31780 [Bacteroidales bacterium]|nr:hypothetical protein [Bacteroidales bacterium]
MKKLILILLAHLIIAPAFAQRKGNFGLFLGGSYYMGDLNYSTHFYQPSFAGGILYRHDFNDRHSAKMSFYYGGLKATAGGNGYLDYVGNQPLGQFSTSVMEIAMMYEFNFLPFNTKRTKENFSPYVAAGAGFAMTQYANPLVLPMGIGLRYNINDRMGVGCFWETRVMFIDHLDRVTNNNQSLTSGSFNMDDPPKSSLNNNDFYNFFGVYLTYKVFEFLEDCPAYEKTSW